MFEHVELIPTYKSSGDVANVSRDCIFFLLTFAHLYLLSSDSTSLLCFSSLHIVGSLTSKLPSIRFKPFYFEVQLLCYKAWSAVRYIYVLIYNCSSENKFLLDTKCQCTKLGGSMGYLEWHPFASMQYGIYAEKLSLPGEKHDAIL